MQKNNLSNYLLSMLQILFLFFFLFNIGIHNPVLAQSTDRFNNITQKSDIVIHALADKTESKWVTNSNGKHIYTFVNFKVLNLLKGNFPQNEFEIQIIGGTVEGITEIVSESFSVRMGDELVLFLQNDPLRVVNGNEGVFYSHNGKINLGKSLVNIDEFVSTLFDLHNSKIEINSSEELERAILQKRMQYQSIPMDTLKKTIEKNKLNDEQGYLRNKLSAPNLTPYKPDSWGDKIIIKKNTITAPIGTQLSADDNPIYDSENLYVAFAVANYGDAAATAFNSKIYIDNILVLTASASSLDAGYYVYGYNYSIGSLSSGTHVIKLVVDTDNQISESNEGDNEYSKNIVIQHLAGTPLISSISPASASAGTGSQITLTGSGFGATKGTSRVDFYYKDGQPYIESSSYISWRDDQIVCVVPIGIVNNYAASASSGMVTVLTGAGRSNSGTLAITFSYGGIKWDGTFPIVLYKINENLAGVTGEGAAIRSAMSTWNSAGANFRFNYGGATTVTASSFDGENSITFGSTSGSLATNYYWYYGSSLLESDVIFNSAQYTFSTNGSSGTYDIQSIVTHEVGHALNLLDLYGSADSDKMMYGYGSSGTIKRNLSSGDISGIGYIYGTGSTPSTYSISGLINYNGSPFSGVLITLSGSADQTITTGSSGTYTFSSLLTGNYTVTLSKTGYTFSPSSISFNDLSSDKNQNFTAALVQYTIAAIASPSAGGTISGTGSVAFGQSVTLTATPNTGYTFTNWTENGTPVSTSANYTFTVSGNRTLVANFSLVQYSIAATASPSSGGTITGGGTYSFNQSVTLVATANTGYNFINWTEGGAVVSTSASYQFTVSGNRNLVANFAAIIYTITTSSNPTAGGTTSGGGTFTSGQSVTISATASTGYTFTNWSENGNNVSSTPAYQFTATANRNLVANFNVVRGDVDGNLSIQAVDASLILQHVVGLVNFTSLQAYSADVNRDGIITAFDAAYILYKVAFDSWPNGFTYLPRTGITGKIEFGTLKRDDKNGSFSLPVNLENFDGVNSIYVEVELGLFLEFNNVSILKSESWLVFSNYQNGKLKIAMCGLEPLRQSTFAVISLKLNNKEAVVLVQGKAKINDQMSSQINSLEIREIPSSFGLSQNYPNPFNPETVIKYQIAVSSKVSLKVFDILGREISVLVDEVQQPGNYNSHFSILNSQFSSGVYFYRLQANDFVETKKMMILK